MAKKKQVDNQALIKMIKEGATQPEIMEKFGFNTSTQLKVAYTNALIESGEAPAIKGAGQKKKTINRKVTVNNRGSLIIPKNIIDSLNINIGDTFETKKTSVGLSLKKIKPESKTKEDSPELKNEPGVETPNQKTDKKEPTAKTSGKKA